MEIPTINFKNKFQEQASKIDNVQELIAHSKNVDTDEQEDKMFVLKELI